MRTLASFWLAVVLAQPASPLFSQAPSFVIKVTNQLDLERSAETVELSLSLFQGSFRDADLSRLWVKDISTDGDILAQAVDSNGDGAPDLLVFQSDFAPKASKSFLLTLGSKRTLHPGDFRVYGRFVRERFDDFVWENDRVAHRIYGAALETWEKEPLTSSGIDVWMKRVPRLVVNDWYMVDDYHEDHGEGGDFYSVGPSRGCGGTGVWKDGRLFVSRNFRESKVFASGPIRLIFEVQYQAWDAGGAKVAERKRITLDAGSHFNRIESVFTADGAADLTWAAGIKKAKGADLKKVVEKGTLRSWEALKEPNGNLGCAIIVEPSRSISAVEAENNVLFVGSTTSGQPVTYYAGSSWDKGGDVSSSAAWDAMIESVALRLRSGLKIELVPR